MAMPGKRTTIKRKNKKKKFGKTSKKERENKGSTIAVPKTGPIVASRFGRAIDPSKIVLH